MRVVVAGGSGFLGKPLVETLARRGHAVVVLSRRPADTPAWAFNADPARVTVAGWSPVDPPGPWAARLDGAGAVINLAGASIGAGRWTAARKQAIAGSRLAATRALVSAIRAAAAPPRLFVTASAVGYYGRRGDDTLTEAAGPGRDFLASLLVEVEQEAGHASPVARVAAIRTGLVLAADGGALPRMARAFRYFAGGPIGSGRQWMSWIHRADWLALVSWVLERELDGPVNATAPHPARNRDFARTLGRTLGRPSFVPAPAFALRILFGEMADAVLLEGQRVLPARALDLGFGFRYPDLADALMSIVGTRRRPA